MKNNINIFEDDMLSSVKHIHSTTNQSSVLINIIRFAKHSNNIDKQMILGKFLTEIFFNLSHEMYDYYFCAINIINKNILNSSEKANGWIMSDFIDQIGRTFKYFPSDMKENLFISICDIVIKHNSSLKDIFIDFINFVYFDLSKANQKYCRTYLKKMEDQEICDELRSTINCVKQKIIAL